MLSMGVAKELGYTLSKLWAEMTPEELLLWSAYFGVLNRQQAKDLEEAKQKGGGKRGRR